MFIEGYKISDLVSQDVVGKTFLATRPESGESVLAKILHENFATDAELVKLFHTGAEQANSISHVNFINLLSHGNESNCAYALFEGHGLPPLSTSLGKSHIFPVIDAANLIEKLAAALETCHANSVTHGILSPSDIFYDSRNQTLKIGNLGFASFYKELIARRDETVTADLHYLAPELAQPDGDLTAQSDVFSLGCLFYRLVLGSEPWSDMMPADLLAGRPRASLVPPSLQRLEVPDILDNVITAATEIEPGGRQSSLRQFRSEVVEARNEILASLTPTSSLIYGRLEQENDTVDTAPARSDWIAPPGVDNSDSVGLAESETNDDAVAPDEVTENGIEDQTTQVDSAWENPFAAESPDQKSESEFEPEPLTEILEHAPDLSAEVKRDEVEQSDSVFVEAVTPPLPGSLSVSPNGEPQDDLLPAHDTHEPQSETNETLPEGSSHDNVEERVVDETEPPVLSSTPTEIRTNEPEPETPQPATAIPAMHPKDAQMSVTDDSRGISDQEPEPILNAEPEQLSLPEISDFTDSFAPTKTGAVRPFPSIQSHLLDDRTSELMPRRQKLNGTTNNGSVQGLSSAAPAENLKEEPQAQNNSEYIVNLSKPAPKVKRKKQKPRPQQIKQVRDNSVDPVVNLKTTHTITIRRRPWLVLQQFPALVWRIAPVVVVGLFVFIAFAMGLPDRVRNSALVRNLTSDNRTQHAPASQVADSPLSPPAKRPGAQKRVEQSTNQLDVGNASNTSNPPPVRNKPENSGTALPVAQRPVTRTQRPAATVENNARQAEQLRVNVQVRSFGAPQVAEVFVDGALYGRTNRQGALLIASLKKARPYLLKVKKNGYQLWAKEVFFPRLGEQTINVNLEAMQQASKQPSATPSAEVNTAAEKQASTARKQSPKRSQTTKNAADSNSAQQTGFGTVNVLLTNTESFADAYIYVNGRRWNGSGYIAPAKLELPPGSYVIAVRKQGYVAAPPSYTLDLVDGETRSLTFILTAE